MNQGTRNYAIVTSAYWGFTLTDGALRMLVLLHFYKLGYSPFTLAFLFLLYEAAGVLANLIGGWLATRYGIQRMLTVGLVTQIIGFTLLSLLNPAWTAAMSRTPSRPTSTTTSSVPRRRSGPTAVCSSGAPSTSQPAARRTGAAASTSTMPLTTKTTERSGLSDDDE